MPHIPLSGSSKPSPWPLLETQHIGWLGPAAACSAHWNGNGVSQTSHWSHWVGSLILGEVGGWDLQVGGLYAPDLPCVLSDGPVAGELARAGNILDHLLGPLLGILSEKEETINFQQS